MADNKTKKGMSSVFAAVGGLVVGAGLAVAGAIALKDKKNEATVKEALKDVRSQVKNFSEKIRGEIKSTKKELEKNAEHVKDVAKKIVKENT